MDKVSARESILRKVESASTISLRPIDVLRIFGFHKSWQRGFGFDFIQHDPFQEGDDLRFVDWNVYGRILQKFSKRFLKEQDVPVLIVVDLTASMFLGVDTFFDFSTLKCEAAFVAAASLHQACHITNDPIGYCFIDPEMKRHFYTPQKGDKSFEGLDAMWDIIWDYQQHPKRHIVDEAQEGGFHNELWRFSLEHDSPSCLIIISDLGETFEDTGMDRHKRTLTQLDQSHAPIMIVVRTLWEYEAPEERAEIHLRGDDGRNTVVDFSSSAERELWERIVSGNKKDLTRLYTTLGIPYAFLATSDSLLVDLQRDLSPHNRGLT